MSKWRLPTVSELQNAFDYEKGRPKINGFTLNYYWSSTVRAYSTGNAWFVRFHDGYTNYYSKSYTSYVRCVKENSNGKLKWSKSSDERMNWEEACKYCKEMNDE